jgi:membrane protein implicated in regulation of membrane protease activity
MHKLPVGGGFAGLVFAVGSAVIFVLGLPSLWYFVAFSAALGVAIAVIFRPVNSRRSDRMKPLSIVATNATEKSAALSKQSPNKNLYGLQATYPV